MDAMKRRTKYKRRESDPLETIRAAHGWDPSQLDDWQRGLRDDPPDYIRSLEQLALAPTHLHAQDELRAREEADRAINTAREAKAASKFVLELYGRGDDLRGVLTKGKVAEELTSREAAPLAVLGRAARRPIPRKELGRRAKSLLDVEFASGSSDAASIGNGVSVALSNLRKRSKLAAKLMSSSNDRNGVRLDHDLVVVMHGDEK